MLTRQHASVVILLSYSLMTLRRNHLLDLWRLSICCILRDGSGNAAHSKTRIGRDHLVGFLVFVSLLACECILDKDIDQ